MEMRAIIKFSLSILSRNVLFFYLNQKQGGDSVIDISAERKSFPGDHCWVIGALSLWSYYTLEDFAALETGKAVRPVKIFLLFLAQISSI